MHCTVHDAADDPRWVLASEPRLRKRAMKLGALMEGVPYDCGTDAMPAGLMRVHWVDGLDLRTNVRSGKRCRASARRVSIAHRS